MNYTFLLLSIPALFFLSFYGYPLLRYCGTIEKQMCEKKCINDAENLKRTNKRLFTESTNIILERFVSVFSLSFTFCRRRLICFNLFNQSIVFG